MIPPIKVNAAVIKIQNELEKLVIECQKNRLFKEKTDMGPVCLLEAAYPQTPCHFTAKEIQVGKQRYCLCSDRRNRTYTPIEEYKPRARV